MCWLQGNASDFHRRRRYYTDVSSSSMTVATNFVVKQIAMLFAWFLLWLKKVTDISHSNGIAH